MARARSWGWGGPSARGSTGAGAVSPCGRVTPGPRSTTDCRSRSREARRAELLKVAVPRSAVPLPFGTEEDTAMDVISERCCGLDIHQRTVVACALTPGPDGRPKQELRSFSTMTADLLARGDWLAERQISHVAMASTGVSWQPLWNLLEERFALLLVNAQHVKAVPGRKTDVKDAVPVPGAPLADRLRHGLLTGSFVPDRPQRELRELTRYRTSLLQERTAEVNRLQKTLEGANIKLAAVATDVLGKSGRAILDALVAGTTEAALLADLAKRRLRAKLPELERALAGRFGAPQRFLLAQQLAHLDVLAETVERL